MEHYVTLFDRAFLPQGLALLTSLRRHAGPFTLWVLAMDDDTARLLPQAGPEVRVIPLAEAETPAHHAVKAGRSRGEWCWTMTPACFRAVFARDATVARVTYLDADLFLLAPPAPLFADLEASGKAVLITDHHYPPGHDEAARYGRFCVQFLTVVRSPAGLAVADWWNERCIEWCFGRVEDGRFGDQKYLDCWPERFADAVHILSLPWACRAPWNQRHQARASAPAPVLYHFHSWRLVSGGRFLWWFRFHLDAGAEALYAAYQEEVERGMAWQRAHGGEPVAFPDPTAGGPLFRARALYRRLTGFIRFSPVRG